ncbi:hypothetical protein NDU88_004966 [Pleurodeles waltl]|uniref:Uncharacterized protein n=1 Tax=Pleurodeles waltl TaxID=8319 RepID=A0AAV7RH75_PLEWA|nr:hypothetical protein NDU88_004966 [Pleurodeles waltl]
MASRYQHERASGAWRAFPQGGPSLLTTATSSTTSTTTTTTQVAPPAARTVAATTPGPSTAPPAGQPSAMDTSSAGTQSTPASAIDPAAFVHIQRKLDRVLCKMSRLRQEVRHVNRWVRSIKRTLWRANL